MKTRTTFILFLTAILTLAAGSAFGLYSGGSGTPGDPYKIATKTDLLTLAITSGDYSKCFILTADINMGGGTFTTAIIAADTNPNSGFQGIVFSGTFDGNDHKITNFTINGINGASFVGLFGYIVSGGNIKNLGLENCSVSGSSGSYYVGGLVGYNSGGISDCYSTGAVSGSGSSNVGGLVGYTFSSSSISNCYSTGSVSGSSNVYVGGLVGFNFSSGNISNCYSTGAVSGSSNVGGLVGYNFGSGSTVSSFWDINTSGQTASAGGTGKTTTQMKTFLTFTSAGWDFNSVWVLPLGQYPMLFLRQAGDLNYDGRVDFADFAIFADNWLAGE